MTTKDKTKTKRERETDTAYLAIRAERDALQIKLRKMQDGVKDAIVELRNHGTPYPLRVSFTCEYLLTLLEDTSLYTK